MPRHAAWRLTAVLTVALTGCGGGAAGESSPTTSALPTTPPEATTPPLPYSSEPIAIEPGTYRIAESAWSIADFSVTFPEGWTVQYGHVYGSVPDQDDEFGVYPVVVDEIFADACSGTGGAVIEVGPGVDDLVEALLRQPGPETSGPVDDVLGSHPASRIDFTVPADLDLAACNLEGIGLQIWYSAAADKFFVLSADMLASAYILDIGGQTQVFLTQHRSATSDDQIAELQAVLDSIRIEE